MNYKYYLRGLGIGMVVTAVVLSVSSPQAAAMSDDEVRDRARALGMIESLPLAELAEINDTGVINEEETAGIEEEELFQPFEEELLGTGEEEGETGAGDIEGEENEGENGGENSGEGSGEASEGGSGEGIIGENSEGTGAGTGEAGAGTGETGAGAGESGAGAGETGAGAGEAGATSEGTGRESNETVTTPTGASATIRINRGEDSYTVSRRVEEAGLVESATEFNNYLMDNNYSRVLRAGDHEIPEGSDYETMARILTGRN